MPDATSDDCRKMVLALFEKHTFEKHFNHAAKQSYVGLCYATIAAANKNADATPMEGFNAQALDELLELKKQDLKFTAILALDIETKKQIGQ